LEDQNSYRVWTAKALEWEEKYDPVRPEFSAARIFTPDAFIALLSGKVGAGPASVGGLGRQMLSATCVRTKGGQRNFDQ